MEEYQLEACVTSLAQALDAQAQGADRVELCIRLETEGMTPDVDLALSLCEQLTIPVRIMVRETETGYEADEHVFQKMMDAIESLKHLPVEGFVFGVLKGNAIDKEAMITLLRQADPLPVTFHKAIDEVADLENEIEWLNQFPQIDTILTSGGAVRAIDGVQRILEMKGLFKGEVMGAGKITAEVLPLLHPLVHLDWYHGRAIL